MKLIHFIALIVAIAILNAGLILGGFSPPLSFFPEYSILFGLITYIIVAYVGWYFSKQGLKKVAIKGFIVMLCSLLVLYAALFIGPIIQRPVLGITTPSEEALLVSVFFSFISSVPDIFLGMCFAVAAAWVALKIKPKKRKK